MADLFLPAESRCSEGRRSADVGAERFHECCSVGVVPLADILRTPEQREAQSLASNADQPRKALWVSLQRRRGAVVDDPAPIHDHCPRREL